MRRSLTLIASVIAAVVLAMAGRSTLDRKALDRHKADLLFLEAQAALAEERIDDYFLMMSRALRLAPDDQDIAAELGEMYLLANINDGEKAEWAYQQMKRRFLSRPHDMYDGQTLVAIAERIRHPADIIMVWTKLDSALPDRTDPAVNLAKAYLRRLSNGDTTAITPIMDICDRLERNLGPSASVTGFRMTAHLMRRDTAAALATVQQFYESSPSNVTTAVATGSYFRMLQMPDSARVYFDRALEIDSLDPNVSVARLYFFRQIDDQEGYEREMLRIFASPTVDVANKLALAEDYLRQQISQDPNETEADSMKFDPAIDRIFASLEESSPGEAGVHMLYGTYLAEYGLYDRAIEEAEYAIDLDKTEPRAWQLLMEVLDDSGNTEGLATAAKRAYETFPDRLQYLMIQAQALSRLGRHEEVIAALLEADPENSGASYDPEILSNYFAMMGDTYYSLKRPEDAFAAYDKALSYNPANYMAMNNVAYFMAETPGSDLDKALEYAKRCATVEPGFTNLDTYAWVLFKRKEYSQAKATIDSALSMVMLQGDPDNWRNQISMALSSGSFNMSSEEAEMKSNLKSDNNGKQPRTATINDMTDADREATIDFIYRQILETISDVVLEHAGDIYFMNGEPEMALKLWKIAFDLNPENQRVAHKVANRTFFFE